MIPSFVPIPTEAPISMPEPNFILVQTVEDMKAAVKVLAVEPILALDTETTGLDPYSCRLLLVQISTPTVCYIFDAIAIRDLTPLKRVLTNGKILKLLQNAKFDWKFLKEKAKIEVNNIFDTYLVERLLTAGLNMPCDLKSICKRYYDYDMSKEEVESFIVLARMEENGLPITDHHIQPEQLNYACRDVLALFGIYKAQCAKLEQLELLTVAWIEFNAIPVFAEMELAGVNVDPVLWRRNLEKAGKALVLQEAELMSMIPGGEDKQLSMFEEIPDKYRINLNSRPQLLRILEGMEIEVDDTKAATFETIVRETDNPFLKLLLSFRVNDKIVNAFGESFLTHINARTGRIHPDFGQYGANSGRVSCRNPNLQQIPHDSDFRDAFVAPKGRRIITSDYSSCELRILGHLSQDPEFLAAFDSDDIDLHTLTASKMFGHEYKEMVRLIKKHKQYRTQPSRWSDGEMVRAEAMIDARSAAKAINFGLAYGMGPKGLSGRINVTEFRAKELIQQYFGVYRGVRKWLDGARQFSRNNLYSVTILGRRWYHPPLNRKELGLDEYNSRMGGYERQGMNGPIQGANADMTKLASIYIRQALRDGNYDARQINQVHDEIVVEVAEDQAEEVRTIVQEQMERAMREIIPSVPAKAEPKISDRWEK